MSHIRGFPGRPVAGRESAPTFRVRVTSHISNGWHIATATTRGLVRARQEDACVVLPAGPTVGVFDGVGGLPAGDLASQAAADGLGATLAQGRRGLLGRLDTLVRRTGGATTACIVDLPSGDVWSIGDCGVYRLDSQGRVEGVAPKDRASRHQLTACLGQSVASGEGHYQEARLIGARAVLVCSDGVDGFVDDACLAAALQGGSLEDLMAAVEAVGAPDNATAILARRIPAQQA